MRATLLLLTLLFAGLAHAAASPLQATAVEGEGRFGVRATDAVVQARPVGSWVLTADHATVYTVDEKRDHEVQHPTKPGSLLFSNGGRDAVETDFESVRFTLVGAGDENATMLLLPHGKPLEVAATVQGRFGVQRGPDQVLERSHYTAPDSVFGSPVYYEYVLSSLLVGEPLHMVPDAATIQLEGTFQVYLWGFDANVVAAGGQQTLRTGYWREETAGGAHSVSHHAYALLNLTGAQFTFEALSPALYSTGLRIASQGSIEYIGASGGMSSPLGSVLVTNQSLVAEAGTFELHGSPEAILVDTQTEPTSIRGQAMRPHGAQAWPWALAALALIGGLLYLAPYGMGLLLRTRGRLPRGPTGRGLRTEGFAYWASLADLRGRARLAAFFAGRAAHHAPKDPDAHMEYAILLQDAGRLGKAVGEHEVASRLFASTQAAGHASLNAYQAAMACARMGKISAAMHWLQRAVEMEPDWAARACIEPALAKLRYHADFRALVGHGDSMH